MKIDNSVSSKQLSIGPKLIFNIPQVSAVFPNNCDGKAGKVVAVTCDTNSVCSGLQVPTKILNRDNLQDLMLVENTQRRATKFICKSGTFSYKDSLLRLRLLPLNYWLEYLDLVFFFKCKCGDINLNIHNYIQ